MPDLVITKARALNATKIRIDFSEPAAISDGLTDPASYTFSVLSSGAIDVIPTAVDLPPGQPNPLFVEIIITEHTDASIYGVELVPSAFLAFSGNPSGGPVANYAGIGIAPVVDFVLAIAKDEVVVVFSEPVLDNPAIRDVDNYSWTNGLETLEVKSVSLNVVTLKTSEQVEAQLYDLTVRGIFAVVINDTVTVTDAVENLGITEDGLPVTEDASVVFEND